MTVINNLSGIIADLALAGANKAEIERATRFSMIVIDCAKMYDIDNLLAKYFVLRDLPKKEEGSHE